MPPLIDTHCHIQDSDFTLDNEEVYRRAIDDKVSMIVIGTSVEFSKQAVNFALTHDEVWAAVAIHPHDASVEDEDVAELEKLIIEDQARDDPVIIAVGECGLDYWYENSDRDTQKHEFKQHLRLSAKYKLPLSLHIRPSKSDIDDAFDDTTKLLDEVSAETDWKFTGVVHSFSAGQAQLDKVLSWGLHVGLNGIATFALQESQQEVFGSVPVEKLVLETDAPYLTPVPLRGKVNEPKNVRLVLEHLARLTGESKESLAQITTSNARKLFNL